MRLTCLMMSQNETRLELRSSDNGGVLPSNSQQRRFSLLAIDLPNHPWHIVGRENPCVEGVEPCSNTDRMRVILSKVDGNLGVVIHHDTRDILSIRSAVHLQKERCRMVPVSG